MNKSNSWNELDDPRHRVEAALNETNQLLESGSSTIAQAILGTLPWSGGVGALIASAAAKRQEARLREFLIELVRDVRRVEDQEESKVDYEVFQSDHFASLLVAILDDASRSADEDRARYLRQFITNSAMRLRPDVTWVDLFQRYLPQLAGAHIELLSQVYDRQKGYSASDRLGTKRLKNIPICVSHLDRPPYGTQLVRVSLSDLATIGLLADWRSLGGDSAPQDCYSLTRNGMLFVKFLSGDWPNHPGIDPVD